MADLAQLRDLASRLADATGPDRELDARILACITKPQDAEGFLDHVRREFSAKTMVDAYTSSIDAAVALCSRLGFVSAYDPIFFCDPPRVEYDGYLFRPDYEAGSGRPSWSGAEWLHGSDSVRAPTPALALCLAIVRAMIAQEEATHA